MYVFIPLTIFVLAALLYWKIKDRCRPVQPLFPPDPWLENLPLSDDVYEKLQQNLAEYNAGKISFETWQVNARKIRTQGQTVHEWH